MPRSSQSASNPRRRLGGERGQSLVEFAITFSILMAFVFMFIEICLAFYTYCMICESAREGSRYAMVHGASCVTASQAPCTKSASDINAYVSGLGYPNLAGGTMTVDTSFPDGDQAAGSDVTITVSYSFPITLALVPSSVWTMSTSSTMSILQ